MIENRGTRLDAPATGLRRFRRAYGEHRAREGRALPIAALLRLPDLEDGPFAPQWRIRRRTFRCFLARVFEPLARARAPPPPPPPPPPPGPGGRPVRPEGADRPPPFRVFPGARFGAPRPGPPPRAA